MLTIFACPKPFTDPHIAIIQRNAITSWTLLRPRPEIILFGDEPGVAEICEELRLRRVPEMARNEYGTPLLSDLFSRAEEIARNKLMCFVNADIIVFNDLINAVRQVSTKKNRFLILGRRCDLDIREPIDFSRETWQGSLRCLARKAGKMRTSEWIDYFVFPRGLFNNIPPFAIGRTFYDNWLIWRARSLRIPVVDASLTVMAIHQNHNYWHHPEGEKGIWHGEEARRNRELAGGWNHFYTINDATYQLTVRGVRRAWIRLFRKAGLQLWVKLMRLTYPLRHIMGLHKERLNNTMLRIQKIWR